MAAISFLLGPHLPLAISTIFTIFTTDFTVMTATLDTMEPLHTAELSLAMAADSGTVRQAGTNFLAHRLARVPPRAVGLRPARNLALLQHSEPRARELGTAQLSGALSQQLVLREQSRPGLPGRE
ncbi:MAG TPA: hypothetical protein VFE51_30055 [Verrucomicrobiae bacterium]|nr:hypothetical protein [Verrucomicrobiae bacterium]